MEDRFTFREFHSIVAALRGEGGCPWDKAQTHDTLKETVIEEAYEVNQAVDDLHATGDPSNLREELGDLLLQIMLHSRIAEEAGEFTLEDVIDGISRKMIRRHPHVFGNKSYADMEEQKQDWEELKALEKRGRTGAPVDELKEVPAAFPSLIRGQKVLKKAFRHRLVPDSKEAILKEIDRSLTDLKLSLSESGDIDRLFSDLGKSLFSVLKLAAKYRINAEMALADTVDSFIEEQENELSS